ncbi:MAG: TRAP transporter TatT component family protein [Myxococcota bacterium]
MPVSFVLVALSLGSGACGTSRQSGICGDINPAPTAQGDIAATEKAAEDAWAQRGDEAQARAAVDNWEKALAIDPSRHDLRLKVARAHYYLADDVLWFKKNVDNNDAAGKEMAANYKAAANQAEMALGQKYPGFRSKFCARQPFSTALEQLDKDAVPGMYWYAAALSRYALMTSIVEVLNQTDRIKAMMDLIQRLQPDYWYYASDRYLGGFYTKIPFPSGDLDLSRKHFEISTTKAPTYLATKVIFAEMNATKANDRALFKRLLDEVVAFDLTTAPEIAPENAAEQKKAKHYLENIDSMVDSE